ncbi:MAG TPA: Ig-like domain-containing protein, partial [Gemmatimonadales bacterium]|nr:Ig-like domain-containing protein [Gemmatimonadales bacterium]
MLPRCVKRLPVALAIVAGACSSEGTGASDVLVVSRIDIEPPGAGLVPGGTQLFTAVPKTSSGIAVPNRTVTWSSANPSIASVSPSG